MRVILEVISGPSNGRKSVMGAFQTLQVGRTEWADFSVPQDGRMSSVHFALETDANVCYVKDLGSRNGTLLNGQPLSDRVVLRQNAEITAGDTVFRIQVETEAETSAPSVVEKSASVAAVPKPAVSVTPPPRPAKRGKVAYTIEPCASGLVLCSGAIADIRPTDLANLLSLKVPLHLIADLRKIEPKPADLPIPPDYLFDWIPPQAAALASPVVVSAGEYAEWPTIIEQAWGNDAVICLFSHYDKSSLMEHLRQCLRAKPKQEDMSAGIVGYCWPGVMSMLLAHGMQNFVRNFFTGIDAVFLELPDLPDCWQLYGPGNIAKMIEDLGFVCKEPKPVKAT